jgi:transaldolase
MRIFLDTAEPKTIEKYFSTGLIDGVTTNPSLILKAGERPDDIYKAIKDIGVKDISMEVSGSANEMLDDACRLADKFGDVTTIKVPCTVDGLKVCRKLSKELIPTNVTLVFTAAQALLATKAGAAYVSPFIGRLDDQSVEGLEVVRAITELYRIHQRPTQVLAASIRSVQQVAKSFANGAKIVTMPPSIFKQMYKSILTDQGLEIFSQDLRNTKK